MLVLMKHTVQISYLKMNLNKKGAQMKYLIILMLAVSPFCIAKSKWGLSQETEDRLSIALQLMNDKKSNQQYKAGINFVTVGDDGSCDYRVGNNRIQSAVDSGADEIRIASNTTFQENIVINSAVNDLNIRGGFADCVQATLNNQSNNIDDRPEITRVDGQTSSVFSVSNLSSSVTITFENLKIVGGNSQGLGSGGGVGINNSDSDVFFNNVWLTGTNKTSTGGGLSVVSSNSIVILNNTDIFNNFVASSGGGIYCNNFTAQQKHASIIITETSNLYSNDADNNGGGAYIGNDCLLSSFSGSSIENGEKGIYLNSADNNGGAVNVEEGGDLLIYGHILCDLSNNCFGNGTQPASVYGNQANTFGLNREGGAISASGTGTNVSIIAGHIYDNSVNPLFTNFGAGGVIALSSHATLNIAHPGLNNSTVSCWNLNKCNLFNNNFASTGGVIYTNDAQVDISHAVFEDNRANSGTVIYVSGSEDLNIENSIFNNNGDDGSGNYDDDYLIQALGPIVNMTYSTIADNNTEQGVFLIQAASSILNLQSSVIHDVNSGNIINATPGTINSNCVMAHELESFSGPNSVVDDPEFIDRANRNYHLNASNSPAVDFCTEFPTNLNKDIDFQERGYDNLSLSNFLGTYDLGADESYARTFLTVGGDATCDFNTATHSIQDAINTGIGEVRIAINGLHDKTTSLDDKNIIIRGGYVDCSAANNDTQTTRTDIFVTNGTTENAIGITGTNHRSFIELENLNLTGKGASALAIINANANVLLRNVVIQNNDLESGFFGGGVIVTQSSANLNMIDTLIIQNSAPQAGGIFCNGSSASITMSGNSGLSQNATTGKGGGAYITGGCHFNFYSGTSNPTELTSTGISANIADEEGGGIYTELGGQVVLNGHKDCSQECIGDDINPISINHNKSNGGASGGERGGGIYMTGSGTKVSVYAGLFSENTSPNGGAIYVNDSASLTVERLSYDCWDNVKCNLFFKNRSFATGGAIQNDQGFINISSAYFEENLGSTGSVLYAFGSNSHNNFEGSVFNNNSSTGNDRFVIRAAVSSNVEISHSTFADNFISNSSVFGITVDSELRLFSTIVHEPDGFVLNDNPGTVVSDCLMVYEEKTLSGTNSTNIYLNDPEFVDRENRDYHLDINSSPAIDVCDDSMSSTQFKDIDFDVRGIDDENVIDVNGFFDLGADEAVVNDIIFKNSFE